MNQEVQLSLVFIAVITGVVAAGYLYQSAGLFVDLLRKPLHLISIGMFTITAGVLLAAFISYESTFGVVFFFYNVPISALFYALYLAGSIFILAGARDFIYRPTK